MSNGGAKKGYTNDTRQNKHGKGVSHRERIGFDIRVDNIL